MMNIKEVAEFLISNGYIRRVKNKFAVTSKFNSAMLGEESGLIPHGSLAVRTPALGSVSDWTSRYSDRLS